jgi:hypothetical protein
MIRRRTLRDLLVGTSGSAAVEMAVWISVIVVPLLSVTDIGLYGYRKMQVEIAAQQAVEAVRRACGFAAAPVTDATQCAPSTLANAISAGRTGTSLGTNVTLVSGYPIEGYYCVHATTGVLTAVGTAGTTGTPPTSPATCATVTTGSTAPPVDYIRVKVTYPYTPMFSNLSVGSLLTTPITSEAWLRLG